MTKLAVVVLADTETHGDLGRAVNALEVAREFEAGDEVAIISSMARELGGCPHSRTLITASTSFGLKSRTRLLERAAFAQQLMV